jgi:hypothetical protein
MIRTRMLRYGLGFSITHFLLIALLIPFEVTDRESRVGILALQVHRIVDWPVWDAPRLLSGVIASRTITQATLSAFPGPSPTPALVGLELAVFGVVGGLLYFVVGIVVAWLVGSRRNLPKESERRSST